MKTMVPDLFRVTRVRRETADTYTLSLKSRNGRARFDFAAGQFNMLYAMGKGEVPISISGDPLAQGPVLHTIRAVGEVFPANSIAVADGGNTSLFVNAFAHVAEPRGILGLF